jgi:hypothetical protein
MGKIRVGFDFSLQFIIALKINISVWILDVNDQRMFLAHFKIIIS